MKYLIEPAVVSCALTAYAGEPRYLFIYWAHGTRLEDVVIAGVPFEHIPWHAIAHVGNSMIKLQVKDTVTEDQFDWHKK